MATEKTKIEIEKWEAGIETLSPEKKQQVKDLLYNLRMTTNSLECILFDTPLMHHSLLIDTDINAWCNFYELSKALEK